MCLHQTEGETNSTERALEELVSRDEELISGVARIVKEGRSQDSRLERHAGYEQCRGMAAHLAGNGGMRRRYGLPYAPSKSPLHAMAASVAAAGKAFMGAVPAATVSGCHERRLLWSPDIGRCETPPEAIGKSDPKRMGGTNN